MPFELTIVPSVENKIWTKHRVLPAEVGETLDDPNLRRFLIKRNRKAREITYLYVGLTYTNRLLRSTIIHKPDGSAYLKTSLDAFKQDRLRYNE
ncbi:hypothetical protein BH24DEI2_BH24DEI2_09420 [soil metagenome]